MTKLKRARGAPASNCTSHVHVSIENTFYLPERVMIAHLEYIYMYIYIYRERTQSTSQSGYSYSRSLLLI